MMKKYIVLALPLLLCACASTVDVDEAKEYKCGDEVIMAEFLDDDSIIARVNGTNSVLSRVSSSSGKRYENTTSGISFEQKSGETYLSINGKTYPHCFEIIR